MSCTLWSKRDGLDEPYSLLAHSLDTVASAMVIWDDLVNDRLKSVIGFDLGPKARSWVAASAGMHDLGKSNPIFNTQSGSIKKHLWQEEHIELLLEAGFDVETPQELMDVGRRHEKFSAVHLLSTGNRGLDSSSPVSAEGPALIVEGHHGFFEKIEPRAARALNRIAGGKWKTARNQIQDEIMKVCGLEADAIAPMMSPDVILLVSCIVIHADRTASEWHAIKSAERDLGQGKLSEDDPQQWVAHRARFFKARLPKTLGVYHDLQDPLEAILGKHKENPRHLQKLAMKAKGGLVFMAAPTGNGKTEAALLRHHGHNERMVFVSPTTVATNSIMKRIQATHASTGNVAELSHGMASIEDFYVNAASAASLSCGGGLVPTEFLQSGTGRLFGPICIATIDQLLVGSLRRKWAHLRLFASGNAHIIIDEAHLLNHYQSALLAEQMKWWGHLGVRVTILSATLPEWQRDLFATAYNQNYTPRPIVFPSMEEIPAPVKGAAHKPVFGQVTALTCDSYKIKVTTAESKDPVQTHLAWVLDQRSANPLARLGVVVNTVGRAQQLTAELRLQGLNPILLHSRMTAGHRQVAEAALMGSIGKDCDGVGTIVVGTQAIESSLDIDLDMMSSDLAPAPSLIQRAGRVWRHEDDRRSERLPGAVELPLHIVRNTAKKGHLPYFDAELRRVWAYLAGRSHLSMPAQSQSFVEATAFNLNDATTAMSDETNEGMQGGGSAEEQNNSARHFNEAAKFKINMDDILDPEANVRTFQQLTAADTEKDELAGTRLIDQPTVTAIVIDPDGAKGIIGAWNGTAQELCQVAAKDRTAMREVMKATAPINGYLALRVIEGSEGKPWAPEAKEFQRMVPLAVGQYGVGYDPDLGILDLQAKK